MHFDLMPWIRRQLLIDVRRSLPSITYAPNDAFWRFLTFGRAREELMARTFVLSFEGSSAHGLIIHG
jgi:hypothetical protein